MNDYNDTLQFLFRLQRVGIKLGLDNIRALLEAVENPQNRWPAIHIAGTNGKGSTAAILESILMKAGYKVGLYTSPHLIEFTERIRINRKTIRFGDVAWFTGKILPIIERVQASFFEATTALAFWYFARENVDVAIVETGMGGRLDSTNVVNPLATLITQIGYDHQIYLGNTIKEIALEKAGIIKSGVPCLTNNVNSDVLEIFSEICQKKGSNLLNVYDNNSFQIITAKVSGTTFNLRLNGCLFENLFINLPGEYQMENMLLAVGTIPCLKNKLNIPEKAIVDGLRSVSWKGRLDQVSLNPNIIIDVSHNPAGFEKTMAFIRKFFPKEKIHVITSLQSDKDFRKIGELLSFNTEEIIITDLQSGKPLNPRKLFRVIQNKGGKAKIVASFQKAKEEIYRSQSQDNLWLIIGSHYLAGEAYRNLLHQS